MNGQAVAKDQVAEVLVGGQDDGDFALGSFEPLVIRRTRLFLRGVEDVTAATAKADDNRSGHVSSAKSFMPGATHQA